MDKPITVARQEFMDALVGLINNSGLPAFAITPILQGFAQKIAELEQQQYEADKAEYEKNDEKGDDDNG